MIWFETMLLFSSALQSFLVVLEGGSISCEVILLQRADDPLGDRIHRNEAAMNTDDGLRKWKGRGTLEVWAAAGGKGEGKPGL